MHPNLSIMTEAQWHIDMSSASNTQSVADRGLNPSVKIKKEPASANALIICDKNIHLTLICLQSFLFANNTG